MLGIVIIIKFVAKLVSFSLALVTIFIKWGLGEQFIDFVFICEKLKCYYLSLN